MPSVFIVYCFFIFYDFRVTTLFTSFFFFFFLLINTISFYNRRCWSRQVQENQTKESLCALCVGHSRHLVLQHSGHTFVEKLTISGMKFTPAILHMYICTDARSHIHTRTHTCTHTFTHALIHGRTHTRTHTFTHALIHALTHTRT